ncbi:MAG: polymerase subunit sigma-24 [Actinomycetia bacterium]|nr:polymerase subunit sigma-24 [Actinomycetes bacterium]
MASPERERFEQLVRSSSGRLLAALVANLGDLDLAQDSLADAFLAAAQRWPRDGFPDDPDAWLYTVARRRALDHIRRESTRSGRERATLETQAEVLADREAETDASRRSGIEDHRLRLVFTCCHPALPLDARVALTLRTLGGLTTAEIGRAFLVPETTMAQRLTRAKRKIRVAGIPYRIPTATELPERIDGVLRVVYLIFNEGYLASDGDAPIRHDLADEAIRLGRLVDELMPGTPEVEGLLSLMLLHHSRRDARVDAAGDLVTLELQDRSLWHADEIAEGAVLVEQSLRRGAPGPFQLQAAIAALTATAPSFEDTDWAQMVLLYSELLRREPSTVVELNRAVAVAFARGPDAGLALLDDLRDRDVLTTHLLPAARADLLLRLGRTAEAREAYDHALDLATQPAERRYLARRRSAVPPSPAPKG